MQAKQLVTSNHKHAAHYNTLSSVKQAEKSQRHSHQWEILVS